MEAPELLQAGFCRSGAAHCGPEKAGGGGEQFAVEDLLDFSNEEEASGCVAADDEGGEGGSDGIDENSTGSSTVTAADSCCNSLSACDLKAVFCRSIADASLPDDFYEPCDAMAELTKLEFEWALSDVSEDSLSGKKLQKLHLVNGVNSTASSSSSSSSSSTATAAVAACQADQVSTFRPEAPVPGKARSKRSRIAPGDWSSRLLVLSHSATAAAPSQDSELVALPTAVAPKKPPKKESAGVTAAEYGRRCLHCQTDKTPQWRTGPMGPKTLCNACGVRFKSGRLVPEYRPASSPTFVVSQHSNSHRKVLELRHQKELQQQLAAPASTLYDLSPASLAGGFLIHAPDIRHLI